jgi:putative glutamine amidotransferase
LFQERSIGMIIGVTDTVTNPVSFERYCSWVRGGIPGVEIRKLSHCMGNAEELFGCEGLVMTGGGDVDPRLYGQGDALHLTQEVDEERDRFELGVIRHALERGMPFLGICRGAQLTNVSLGGSLHIDLEMKGYPSHRKTPEGDRRHAVIVEPLSVLCEIVGRDSGEVNSAHHQAIDSVGRGLRVVAKSPEGIVEALEWENPGERPFLLLVQWHPERMFDNDNPFTRNILQRFAIEAHRFTTPEELA